MTIKPIVIGGVTVPNNVFFAPLAGFSTAEMRHAAYKAGAGLCFTEMVSAKGLMYAPDASIDLLVNLDENKPTKWKIENSWGDDVANKGYYTATDTWFSKFVYQIVVNKKYLTEKEQEILKEEKIRLKPWDPMGTLA